MIEWPKSLSIPQGAFSVRAEKDFRPWQWVLAFIGVAVLDYLTGPNLHSAVLFYFIPVAMAAWSGALWWSLALATAWPPLRLGIQVLWHATSPWALTIDDTLLNWIVSAGFAGLVWHVVRQERRLRVLQGMLPICSFCKRIRTGAEWQQMEQYITEHSEARFSHTYCPDCGRQHYPQYFN